MLTLSILGFLAERPLHAYELRRRISDLIGHNHPISDGALYPAVNRLRQAGHVERRAEPGESAPTRQMLSITASGRAELLRRLTEPKETEITDGGAFFTLLAFLSQVPDPAHRAAVLRRRLAFLTAPAGFFTHSGRPVRIKDEHDPYRKGMLIMARAAQQAERTWLEETLRELEKKLP
ncbi:PadR family transcriptional regulator [Streptomyces sp. LaPpAH-108]|uniref:PadR family transcriptional regulator n=1 Tax=Streptomyces sp. LaPpAH-108 TaxID=1155714 RepID=UPI0003807CCC|nr:PadR family transcriptional regulator [Streptomyces sp. LaPpAH-108]